MPHLFVNRGRLHGLTKDRADVRMQFRWETINAVLYVIGGIVFIVGSIFFFPRLDAYVNIGAWTFFTGSLLYLIVTLHDVAEVRHYWGKSHYRDRDQILEYTAAVSYLWGTILFVLGSVFFLSYVGWFKAGAWCFVFGSLLFVVGACINVLQIVKSDSITTLQLMNLTAVSFVVGSVLFTVASVPYLWKVRAESDRTTLYAYLAWQYLIGSLLFFAGGVFNFRRAYLIMREQVDRRNEGKTSPERI
jgi:hypothetical protein